MLFVNLLYLGAAAAVAGPLLLHLLLRQRPRRQMLPTLRFLTAAAPQSFAMHKLKNLLLLISRILLILLIAFAFARPFIKASAAYDSAETAELGMVLVLDISLSMRSGDTWDEALTRARNALLTLPENSPAALIVFDRNPRVSVSETRDLARVNAELRVIEPGYDATDLVAALRAGAEAGNQLNARRTRVVVISDYQRTALRQALAPLPVRPGVVFEPIQVGVGPLLNVSIASAQVISGEVPGKRNILLDIRRYGEGDAEGEVELFDNGATLGVQPLHWNSEQAFVEFVVDEPRSNDVVLEAVVRTSDSPAEDNRYNILMQVRRSIPVLVLEQTGRIRFASNADSRSPSDVNRFMRAAVDACKGLVDAVWFDGTELSIDRLIQYPVVLALDVDSYAKEAVAALEAYVDSGGALVIFPGNGETSAFESFSGSTIEGWTQLDRQSSQYRLVSGTRQQGPLSLLGNTAESVLGHPKVYRYLTVVPGTDNGTATVAQFDNGAPFLLERRMGDGLVYLFTVPLDASSTDFVLRASFAPFLYELMAHATRETEARRRYWVGDRAPAPLRRGVHTVYTPDRKRLGIQDLSAFTLPGVYILESDSDEILVSVNIDPLESDLTRLNRAEIDGIRELRVVGDLGGKNPHEFADVDVGMPPDESGKFWRYLLIAALALMAFESLLASRTIR